MIAIIDSGSTKSDWVILENNPKKGFEKEILRTETIGLNPYFITKEEIVIELQKNEALKNIANKVTHIYFYGAGCSNIEMNLVLENAFTAFYPKANINIQHDLLAAAYAAYDGKPTIVCILGTGSNACYFDGETLSEATPSLGFILGDEGSGNNLGKRILQSYFLNKMPQHLINAFQKKYQLTADELCKNIYQKKLANAYLASFNHFVEEHKNEPYIQQIIYSCMKEFFVNQVLPFKEARFADINFIGSVAHYNEDTLRAVASELHLNVGVIVKKPIDNLVKYHQKYILIKFK